MPSQKNLPVPYFVQPTSTSCQGTVLKMMASYLDNLNSQSGAGGTSPTDIKSTINSDKDRPVKSAENSHANMKWWLERNYPQYTFDYARTTDQSQAIDRIVRAIDMGFPVLMSVSHSKVQGHIVLVIGYSGYQPFSSSADFRLVAHDPYGRFDPSLLNPSAGKKRWDGGMSLASGGENGPGSANVLAPSSLSRRRSGDSGAYIMLHASGWR
jgi:hypothetical protein